LVRGRAGSRRPIRRSRASIPLRRRHIDTSPEGPWNCQTPTTGRLPVSCPASNVPPQLARRIWPCTLLQAVCEQEPGRATASATGATCEAISGTVH
jgi:hypothetical protein